MPTVTRRAAHKLPDCASPQAGDNQDNWTTLAGVADPDSRSQRRESVNHRTQSHALVVGVSDYADAAAPPLDFSVSDAQEIAHALTMPEYGYTVAKLLDEQATRAGLLQALHQLFEGDADNLLLYFSGHGASFPHGAYLCTVDANPNDLGVDLPFLARLVAAHARPGRTTTIILDCCHAGAMTFASVDRSAPLLRPPQVTDSFVSLPEGNVLFAACRSDEAAHESLALGHGLFTYHLIEALLGSAANDDGNITAASLHDFLSRSLEGHDIAQTIVYRGDIAGVFVLGRGFAPIKRRPSSPAQIAEFLEQGRRHLDDFQRETGRCYAERKIWSQTGYKAACQQLRPIVRWFSRREEEFPELKNHSPFRALVNEARAWQARLGDIENVSETPWGRVERRLGYGTFGTVWLLRDERSPGTSKQEAFKLYHGQDIRLQDKASRFRRGFEAMKMLDHPRVIKVGELSECPLGFSMEYIEGPNFREFTGTLDVPEQLRLLLTVAETLAHAHSRGVVHRDVKPENILLRLNDGTWLPHLADFDLAWFSTASVVTQEAIGSAFYCAPEQIQKPRAPVARDPRVDQYAFGQLLFFGLTGTDPVQNPEDNVAELRARFRQWPSGDAANATVSLYERATELRQARRYSTVRDICDELHRIVLLAETNPQQVIPRDRMVRELVFGLVGISEESQDSLGVFRSLSDRTLVDVLINDEREDSLSLRFRLERLGPLVMEGLDHEAARRKLNMRVDEVLRAFADTQRVSGHQGTYEVFVSVRKTPKTMLGVERSRKILSRVIEAIERG